MSALPQNVDRGRKVVVVRAAASAAGNGAAMTVAGLVEIGAENEVATVVDAPAATVGDLRGVSGMDHRK